MLHMIEQADEQNKGLVERMMMRKKLSLEEEDEGVRSQGSGGGIVALRSREVGCASGDLGGEFGHWGAAQGAKGGKLSPQTLEKCRAAGREAGPRGAAWGRFGGRKQNECKSSSQKLMYSFF